VFSRKNPKRRKIFLGKGDSRMCHYFFICIYKEELTKKKSIKETKTYSVFLYIEEE